jgi:peptide/nickel transport system substrate-binding protein
MDSRLRQKILQNRRILDIALSGFLLCAMAGCNEKEDSPSMETSLYPREQTLYVGGFDWAPPGTTFNPLDADPNFPIDGNMRLMYESLFSYNMLDGKTEPMLASSYTQTDSSIIVTLDSRARWNTGEQVTADDVLYTFYLDSLFPTPRHTGWQYIERITNGKNGIEFIMNKENRNPLVLLNLLSETSILPKKVFEPLVESSKKGNRYNYATVLAFKNDSSPVVSGPYNLEAYYPDKIVLKRVENYWGNIKHDGKAPAPLYIVHSLYTSNNLFNNAMTKGELDVSSIFMPRIWEKKRDDIRAWSLKEPYHYPGSIPTLFIATTTTPFTDVAFRRALAHAINFEKIKTVAVSNYTANVEPGFILPFGQEAHYFNADDAKAYGYSYDLEKAKKILEDAGYSWDPQGKLLNKDGRPIRPLSLECPQGWTDWEDIIKVVAESFRQIGIETNQRFVDYGEWEKDLRYGKFDLAMKTQTADLSAATPWTRFDQVMNSKNTKPVGEEAFSNQGRFTNPQADSLLEIIPAMTDTASLKEAYRALNRIFMEQVPVLPLMYRPTQYYQFSTKHWTNFPTEENPYAPPQSLIVGAGTKALWEIKPVKSN